MCKLLLQMEDETDSKRSLRHDQYQQRVKHEFGHRYSLAIVSLFVRISFHCLFSINLIQTKYAE